MTCGFTVRFNLASTNTVWMPCALMIEIGIETPCSMAASMLSMVEMRGDDRMRICPDDSIADSRRFRLNEPPSEPSIRPSAPPLSVATLAGKLTA